MTKSNKSKMDKKSQRIKILRFLLITVGITVAVAVVIVVLNFLIVVRSFKVKNMTSYPSHEIVSSSEIDIGSPFLTVNFSSARNKIMKGHAYIKNVELKWDSLSSITIEVTNTEPYMAIYKGEEGYIYLDKSFKILDMKKYVNDDLVVVKGMSFDDYYSSSNKSIDYEKRIGTKMTSDDNIEIDVITSVMESLDKYGLLTDLNIIDLSIKYDLSCTLDKRVFVKIGTADNYDKKFEKVKMIIDRYEPDVKMEINVSDYTKGRCRILS